MKAVPNKPMVPTATTWLNEHSPRTLRRHIGQSLGKVGLRVVKSKARAILGR